MESVLPLASVRVPLVPRRAGLAVGVACAVVATGTAAAMGAGAEDHAGLVALARGAMVGVPLAVGLYAWHRRPGDRFGLLLAAAGAGALLTTFGESDEAAAYTAGRVAGWLLEILLVYLILAFPSGRLAARVDRLIVGAFAAVTGLLVLSHLVLAERFAVPSPYTSCTDACPPNALFALEREPAFVGAVLGPLIFALVVVAMAAVVMRLVVRTRAASPLSRRMYLPLVTVAGTRAVLVAVAFPGRELAPDGTAVEVASWLVALTIPVIAVAFFAGLVRWRLFSTSALERLATRLQGRPDAAALRRALADAFDDPSIQIAYPASRGRWVDGESHTVASPRASDGRRVRDVRDDGVLVAAVVHDEALLAEPALLDAGVDLAAATIANDRLAATSAAAVREVRDSRARLATSAERERRRIEQDLHDGAQQRLVALRIELQLTADIVREDPELGVERLRELEARVEEALEEVRSLAHGVCPPILADHGLVGALRARAAHSPVPIQLVVRHVGRYTPEVESAVYFCVLEALQNVAKHATGARRVVVSVAEQPGELRLRVRDDGSGPASGTIRAGAGVTNMRDRLATVGGVLEIRTVPGSGTTVDGRVPLARQADV